MKHRVLAMALAAALSAGIFGTQFGTALADGAASTRNIILLGVGGGFLVTNYNHKVRAKRVEQQQVTRRQSAYRDWFYSKYSYYPTYDQFKEWYVKTYGVNPE
jgi:hypothetical protein